MINRIVIACLLSIYTLASPSFGQEISASNWDGEWIADGTLFRVAVNISNGEFIVNEVDSLGFVWTTKNGIYSGDRAVIEAEYAGATAVVEIQLIDPNTAIANLRNCVPEYIVVCVLAMGQQARFIRATPSP